MREKILAALRNAGHGLTQNSLVRELGWQIDTLNPIWERRLTMLMSEVQNMERERLLILHRADGSGGTTKGQIVLICLRPEGY